LSILFGTNALICYPMINVAVVEDIEEIRTDVEEAIADEAGLNLLMSFGSAEAFLDHAFTGETLDVLILDIGLPGMSGIDAIPLIRGKFPQTEIIMFTAFEQQDVVLRALCQGAVGYISKETELDEILEGIRTVKSGGSYMSPQIAREIVKHFMRGNVKQESKLLSERQMEIIERLAEGKTYGSIAEEIFVSVETVRSHIKKMYRILQVNNKTEAIAMYMRGAIG